MRRFAVAALAVLGVAASALAAPIDSEHQPVFDGCRRSTGETLAGTTPEWAYVYADPAPRTLDGIVAHAAPALEDNPTAHESYDFNFDVWPDPDSAYLLSTANPHVIHVEWEEAVFPAWARPTKGDRVSVVGAWVWDCGHWGSAQDPRDDPAAWVPYAQFTGVTGESTEIHPPRAVFVARAGAASAAGAESRADLFISSRGTLARQHAECHLSVGLDPAGARVNEASAFQRVEGARGGCSQWQPVNDRDYVFEMPLPPGDGPISVAFDRLERVNAPLPEVMIGNETAIVRVPWAAYAMPLVPRPDLSLGATIVLRRAAPTPSATARVTLQRMLIHTDLDTEVLWEQGVTTEPSEYNMYADVAGTWVALHEIAPAMTRARAGDIVDLHTAIDVAGRVGDPFRLFLSGRECDLPWIEPCRANRELGFAENPGTIAWTSDDVFAASAASMPQSVTVTSANGTRGCGCFTLEFTIERTED